MKRMVVGAGLALLLLWPAYAASAVGPGTFTRITTPGADETVDASGGPTITIAGQTSPDVTSVDLDCVYSSAGGPTSSQPFASGVPVTSSTFQATVTYPTSGSPTCRLRAVPTGVDINGYLGAYTGPVLRTLLLTANHDGSTPYGYTAALDVDDGVAVLADAGSCGDAALVSVAADTQVENSYLGGCVASLPGVDLAGTGSTIKVDGHTAWLPAHVHSYLADDLSLPLTPHAETSSLSTADGATTVTESAELQRCSASDTFPPTPTSCPSLVDTGVVFTRVSTFGHDGHQLRLRDSFTSGAASHQVGVQYVSMVTPPLAGSLGFQLPGSGSYTPGTPGAVTTQLGQGAGTVLIRSDLHSLEGDPQADTRGLTWSRPPTELRFDPSSSNRFAMTYGLSVPAGGAAYVGFADSESPTTSAVHALAAQAIAEMVPAPAITTPANGAAVTTPKVTVSGAVGLGANGLPTAVTVNGQPAALTPVNATFEGWSAAVDVKSGAQPIDVEASDSAGNTATAEITVHETGLPVVHRPKVTSPHSGATVSGARTTIKGKVSAGSNGLPVKVTVNGHKARLKKKKKGNDKTATWSVSLALDNGTNKVKVVATDSSGATATTVVKIHHQA